MDSTSFLELAKGFGTAAPIVGLLLWLYAGERSDRKDLQAKLLDLSIKGIEADNAMTHALDALAARLPR